MLEAGAGAGVGTKRALDQSSRATLYSDGLYHDPACDSDFAHFLASYNLRRLEGVISTLRWENFQLKERLTLQ